MSKSRARNVVIAWQGLPFYARRCIRYFRERNPEIGVTVVTSRAELSAQAASVECSCPVVITDSEIKTDFARLGISTPDYLLVTSWSHAAYRDLAREVKAAGGGVVAMIDNCFYGSVRQWLGTVYFRLKIRRLFDDAWVPGEAGKKFVRMMGVPAARTHTGLYCADETVFHPPAEPNARREGVIFVGQLIERKGVRPLVSAWKTLNAPPLTLMGAGVLRDELNAAGAVVEVPLAPRELAARLRSVQALILPSFVDHWGLVLHEAALSGCALLATRRCGASEDLIEHRVNGYVLRDNSRAEIAAAVGWLQGLSPDQARIASEVSVQRATGFTRARWNEVLSHLLATNAGRLQEVAR